MPRRPLPPRLYLRKDRGGKNVWIIRDRNRDTRTGCGEDDKIGAMRALAEFQKGHVLPPRNATGSGFIYFITCVASPHYPIKIGWSATSVGARVAGMQVGNPNILQAIATFRGTYEDERSLHIYFAHIHIRGEWFRRTDELMEFLKEATPDDQTWGAEEFVDDGSFNAPTGINGFTEHQT